MIKIADFGAAVWDPQNRQRDMIGTRETMAPEMVQGVHYGNKVDNWSLGILIYELCTGSFFIYNFI